MSEDRYDPAGGIFEPRADEEVYEAFPQEAIPHGMDPQDGMPRPAMPASLKDAYAPPLTPETLVCMADESEFVIRDEEWGTVLSRVPPDKVERAANGRYRAQHEDVLAGSGDAIAHIAVGHGGWVEVFPLRPQCRFYMRQITDFQDDRERKFIGRLCMARRNTEEGFFSLRDSQVFGCDVRDPIDAASVEAIDVADREKIRLGRQRLAEEDTFDVMKALQEEESGNG